jgi:hypothetical protein
MHAPGMIRLQTLVAGALLLAGLSASEARADVQLPNNTTLNKVDFERHIMGLFGRAGCNAGSCHGSFQGKGGFRLSLFGFEPARDYFALTRDSLARRINPVNPDQSLLLLKATGQVEHGGGVRFGKDSWQYKVIREWIAAGAPWQPGSGEVKSVRISPAEFAFKRAGESVQLKVFAQFKDGSENDITTFCDYRTNDDAVAEVSPLGVIGSLRPGATAIVVSYRGNVRPVRVLVPMDAPPNFVYPKLPEVNYIDREVFTRLKQLNMIPSDLASDAEFLRRVTIDTIGRLPDPEEVRAFLAHRDPDKRAKKIDELLDHPLHAALWATKFCDILGNDTQALEQPVQLKPKRSQMWHDWLRKRLAENMPYDELVHNILCATSREGRSPIEWLEQVKTLDQAAVKGHDFPLYAERKTLDLFWRRQANVPIELWGEKTAAAFMGIRLECAQCHKHPYDRWAQEDYRAYANVFSTVAFAVSPESKQIVDAENKLRKTMVTKENPLSIVREVFLDATPKMLLHPETNRFLGARAPGGPVIPVRKGEDPRQKLFEWLRTPDNPFFARAFVNRVWGHYFSIGIVHPVDDFSLANPPSNEQLLDALAKDFIENKFDIRHIERRILNSRTYQLSSKTNPTNKLDKNNFARSYVRPMMAEQVVDVLNAALGVEEKWSPDIRPGSKAIEVGPSQLQNPALNYTFRIFGRPPRTAACDCERAMDPALPQMLYLMTDQAILDKLRQPQGRLQKLLRANLGDDELLDELFLATLSRYPTAGDREVFAKARARARSREAAFTDAMWALINTREFILNH